MIFSLLALIYSVLCRGVEIEIIRGQHCGAKIQLGATRISLNPQTQWAHHSWHWDLDDL